MKAQSRSRAIVMLALLALATTGAMLHHDAPTFPHSKHAKLFPTCASCHSGVITGDAARVYPTQAVCASCHNGSVVKSVSWRVPTPPVTNLKFSHELHASASAEAGNPATCASCHGTGGDTTWMHVSRAEPARCLGCHLASGHLAAGNACATCHVPLTQARGLSDSVVAHFPKPPSHAAGDFISRHAPGNGADLASCATCHARESCARCHANAQQRPEIAQLASDARIARLVAGKPGVYPTPATHSRANWKLTHGTDARSSIGSCANCHTQKSCTTCHTGTLAASVIRGLPASGTGMATGVQLYTARGSAGGPSVESASPPQPPPAVPPPSPQDTADPHRVMVHEAGFLASHKHTAASGALNCQGCHETRECTSCHSGTAPARSYHPADFVSRHGTEAFRQNATCNSCHRTETFCRSCHQSSGMASSDKARGTAHASQPLWLLQHGQAARQGLTGCTTCHQQRDCLRCHSTVGQNVNPHGDGFNASTTSQRNKQVCFACHVTDPMKK